MDALDGCNWIVPQKTLAGDRNSYYTFGAKLLSDDIEWTTFRKKYVELGGSGIYAAWSLCYKEDSVGDIRKRLLTPIGLNENNLPFILSDENVRTVVMPIVV